VTAPGGSEADRAARERLAREARVTATTLLDWVGTRVEGAATTGTARPAGDGAGRPRQSPGPCGWCPVCALVAAVRGEQPELTAHLAEQASALLVVLRLLIQSHAHDHPAHGHPAQDQRAHDHPAPTDPVPEDAAPPPPAAAPTSTGPDLPGDLLANPDVPWDAPHAVFDPDPAPTAPASDGSSRPAPDRPTGKRGPRPSPRPRPLDVPTTPAAPMPGPTASPAPAPVDPRTPTTAARVPTGTRAPAGPAPARSDRGVQRIPVRRRPRPC
jgi:hypothetical protein